MEVILNADKTEVDHEGFLPDRYSVLQIIAHRNYSASLDYDAALIKLERRVDLTKTAPVCLPSVDDIEKGGYVGVSATVTGTSY